jgi:hypothetical protein
MKDATTALINILKHCADIRLLTASDLAYILSAEPPFDLVHDLDWTRGTQAKRHYVREALLVLTRQHTIDWTHLKSETAALLKTVQAEDATRAQAGESTRPIPVAIEIRDLVPDGTVLNWFTGGDGDSSFVVVLLCRLPNDNKYITARRLADLSAPKPWPEIVVEPSWRVHLQNAVEYKKSVWLPVLDSSKALWSVLSVLDKQQHIAPIAPSAELVGLVPCDQSLLMIACSSHGGYVSDIDLYDVMQKREYVTLTVESFRLRRILCIVAAPDRRVVAIGDDGDRTRLVQLLGPVAQDARCASRSTATSPTRKRTR